MSIVFFAFYLVLMILNKTKYKFCFFFAKQLPFCKKFYILTMGARWHSLPTPTPQGCRAGKRASTAPTQKERFL